MSAYSVFEAPFGKSIRVGIPSKIPAFFSLAFYRVFSLTWPASMQIYVLEQKKSFA